MCDVGFARGVGSMECSPVDIEPDSEEAMDSFPIGCRNSEAEHTVVAYRKVTGRIKNVFGRWLC